jgi:hypothetical protein
MVAQFFGMEDASMSIPAPKQDPATQAGACRDRKIFAVYVKVGRSLLSIAAKEFYDKRHTELAYTKPEYRRSP